MDDVIIREFEDVAGGHRLQIQTIGTWTVNHPVLVFLHEGLGSITQWRDFPLALCKACNLPAFMYDRYGYGRSDPLQEPRPDDFLRREAETLVELLAKRGILHPILIGHSDGGTIALMAASLYPHHIKAVITEAAHVMFEAITKEGLSAVYDRFKTDEQLQQGLARHHGANTQAMVTHWAETWLRPSLADWTMLDMLPVITCPVLAIQGTDDDHGSPEQIKAIKTLISGTVHSVMIDQCGHIPHFQARDRVIEEIVRFLSTTTAKVVTA